MTETDDNYRRAAEVVYVQHRQLFDHSLKTQAEYGRWLISSLLFLHGAAIAGLLFRASGANPPPYLSSLWWFIFGIVFALGSGFAAWWNFSFTCRAYNEWSDHRMLTNRNFWPAITSRHSGKITATLWISNICGIFSVLCLLAGALAIWLSWR